LFLRSLAPCRIGEITGEVRISPQSEIRLQLVVTGLATREEFYAQALKYWGLKPSASASLWPYYYRVIAE